MTTSTTTTTAPAPEGEKYRTANDTGHRYVGGTILRVYYVALTTSFGIGPEFSSKADAIEVAREHSRKAAAGEFGQYASTETTVETRMEIRVAGGVEDKMFERMTVRP